MFPRSVFPLAPLFRPPLHEGRYHHVRRLFAATGNHVQALHRSRIGGPVLDDLPQGQWRALGAAAQARPLGAGEPA